MVYYAYTHIVYNSLLRYTLPLVTISIKGMCTTITGLQWVLLILVLLGVLFAKHRHFTFLYNHHCITQLSLVAWCTRVHNMTFTRTCVMAVLTVGFVYLQVLLCQGLSCYQYEMFFTGQGWATGKGSAHSFQWRWPTHLQPDQWHNWTSCDVSQWTHSFFSLPV